jgi:hypothetical protein
MYRIKRSRHGGGPALIPGSGVRPHRTCTGLMLLFGLAVLINIAIAVHGVNDLAMVATQHEAAVMTEGHVVAARQALP